MRNSGRTHEEEVILQIQRENGVDDESNRKARQDPELGTTLENLKRTVSVTLDLLSDELYTKPAHCVLEMIQNADDNEYAHGVRPELKIELRREYMEIRCNEVGFTDANVRAFCGIRKSTKKNQTGYIGEKGIGAKSIFKVARKVTIQSRGFSFQLDRDAELGMISPVWYEASHAQADWTTMRLDFVDENQFAVIQEQLREIRDTVLLFLRKLSKLSIDDGEEFVATRSINGNILELETVITPPRRAPARKRARYLRVAHQIIAAANEEKRGNQTHTEIVLAFPLQPDCSPMSNPTQMVHAFLPLRCVGFRFLIQADFLTAANREDILVAKPWNQKIRDSVCEAFFSALPSFNAMEPLQLTWLRFFPRANDVAHTFFAQASNSIRQRLGSSAIVLCDDGKMRRPSEARFQSNYCGTIDEGPLLESKFISFAYVSPNYASDVVGILRQLGAKDMSYEDFLDGLWQMHRLGQFHTQSAEWLEDVCGKIVSNGFKWTRKNRTATYVPEFEAKLRRLPLVALQDHSWTSCTETQAARYFFDDSNTAFPAGLRIEVLKMNGLGRQRRDVLTRLGVRVVNSSLVLDQIIEMHRPSASTLSSSHIFSHISYAFERRHDHRRSDLSSLWLIDTSGIRKRGSQLYMDDPRHESKLSDLLGNRGNFISASFKAKLDAANYRDLCDWLQSTMGVSVIPRVTANGSPSPEFAALIEELRINDTVRLLTLMRLYWPRMSTQMQWASSTTTFKTYMSAVQVRCKNGIIRRLDATYLLNASLKPFVTDDMPLLPIDDLGKDWSFLRNFGVSSDVNAEFFLKRLRTLASAPPTPAVTVEVVTGLYKQLESRFYEMDDTIRSSFKSSKLILVGRSWVSLNDIVWDGPPIMTSRHRLKRTYPYLQTLFQTCLGLQSATDYIIRDELRNFAAANKDKALLPEDIDRLRQLLSFGNTTIEQIERRVMQDWTAELREAAIFPVRYPDGQVRLHGRSSKFYVPDPSGELEKTFKGKAPFLDIDPGSVIRLRPLLARFAIEDKRIDKVVKRTVTAGGRPLSTIAASSEALDKAESTFYYKRMTHLQRLYFYKKEKELPVQSIRVFNVETLEVSFGVEGNSSLNVSAATDCWSVIDTSSAELWLFVADTIHPEDRRDLPVAEAIAQTLHLSASRQLVRSIIHDSDRNVERSLQLDGVRELPEELRHTFENPEPFAEDPAATAESQLENLSLTSQSSPLHGRNNVASPRGGGSRRRGARQNSSAITAAAPEEDTLDSYLEGPVGRAEVATLEQYATRTAIRTAAQPSAGSMVKPAPSRFFSSTHRRAGSLSQSIPAVAQVNLATERTGFLGEKFVFDMLRSNLPSSGSSRAFRLLTSSTPFSR